MPPLKMPPSTMVWCTPSAEPAIFTAVAGEADVQAVSVDRAAVDEAEIVVEDADDLVEIVIVIIVQRVAHALADQAKAQLAARGAIERLDQRRQAPSRPK